MTPPVPCLLLPGTARQALDFYAGIFGGEVHAFSYADMSRTDGPADHVGFGQLTGVVDLFICDSPDSDGVRLDNVHFSLLGTVAEPELRQWFAALADGGTVLDQLQLRPWGDWDGEVRDRFGVQWLIGFQGDQPGSPASPDPA